MGKLKLKDQSQGTRNTRRAWLHSRHAQPLAVSAFDRFCAALKRLFVSLLFATAATALFLAIPFRHWDHYEDWAVIQDALTRLAAQTASNADIQRLHSAATAIGILWSQPEGPHPAQWAPLQSLRYDAAYGVVQTLALGIIKQGNTSRGYNELIRLQQRTENADVPNIPSTTQFKPICPICEGKGTAALNKGFPLTATLRNTFMRVRKLQGNRPVFQKCPSCQGSGTLAKPDSQYASIASSIPSLVSASAYGTLINIDEGMIFWTPLHALATAQRAILKTLGLAAHAWPQTRADAPTVTDPFASLRTACEALLKSPKNEPDAQILAEAAKSEDTPPALRNLAMSAFGISLLMRENTGSYSRVCAIQKSTFGEPYPAPLFTAGDYTANCKDCLGKGERPYPCPTCMGPNACSVCKGKGQTQTVDGFVPCRACKNTPDCLRCKGKKSVNAFCTTCRGEKKIYMPSTRVRAAYGDVLTNLIAHCDAAISENPTPLASTTPQESKALVPALIILGVTLPAALLIYFFMKWKRVRQFSTLPGMENIDTDLFIDPLSLSAQEGRNNVKRKTARIPAPDKYDQA